MTEPRVFGWYVAALVLLITFIFLVIREYADWRSENRVLTSGTPVNAVVIRTMTSDGAVSGVTGNRVLPGADVVLKFEWAGRTREVTGPIGNQFNYLAIGSTLPIRVDPDDPDHWTAAVEASPVTQKLVFALIPLAFAVLASLCAWRATARVVRLWKHGEACRAVIVQHRTTALVPSAYAISCAFQDDVSERLVSAYLPKRNSPADGVVWLLVMPDKLKRAVAAAWFE